MDSARWKQVQELFHRAFELDEGGLEKLFEQTRPVDPELEMEVRRLLKEDRKAGTEWERNLSQLAGTATESALPREDLGQYRFVRLLGSGGMGMVFEGEHTATGRRVAIKVLRSGELSAASRERFATEQRALARLDHPSIARLYSSESFRDGTPCFVMEYVEGESLTAYCLNNNCSLTDRMQLFRQVCEAVQHAHERGVIHRDLKPSNILVKKNGAIRLLDFGIAKQLDAETPMTVTGAAPAPMTLAYAAPEQVRGGTSGTQTDIYSLGATLYELLTGKPPFNLSSMTPATVETVICSQAPKRPSSAALEAGAKHGLRQSGVDWRDLDLLCLTAMHKDPLQRYRSVDALIRDVDHWLAHEPLDARQESTWYRLSKFGRRNKRSIVIAAALGSVAVATAGWFTWNLSVARDEAIRQQARTKRVEQFVFSIFQNGNASVGFSKNTTALTLLERSRRQAEALQAEPQFQRELYSVLGSLYGNLGQFGIAERLLSAAHARLESDKGQSVEIARSLIALSSLWADQSNYSKADVYARRALTTLNGNKTATQLDIAAAEMALGRAVLLNRDFHQAQVLLEDALRRQTLGSAEESDKADTRNLLAQTYQVAGNYTEASKQIETALAIHRKVYADLDPRIGQDFQTFGDIRILQFRLPEAEDAYTRTLQIYDAWYGPGHPKSIESRIMLGQALVNRGRLTSGRRFLSEGLTAGRQIMGENHPDILFAVMAMGTLEQDSGNYDAARIYFKRALAGLLATFGENTEPVAIAEGNLGTLELKADNAARAEVLYRSALKTLEHLLPGSGSAGRLQINLGKALAQLRRYREAEGELREGIAVLRREPDKRPEEIERAESALEQVRRHL